MVFPAGQRVIFETAARPTPAQQQVWMIEGQMHISLSASTWLLHAGDSMAVQLNQPITYRNRSRQAARYLVAVNAPAGSVWARCLTTP